MRLRIRPILGLLILLLLAIMPTTQRLEAGGLLAENDLYRAPLLGQAPGGAEEHRYIVVLKDGVGEGTINALANNVDYSWGGKVHREFSRALRGFSATLTIEALEALRMNPQVAYIEAEQEYHILETQTNPPWGLDRIDQRESVLDRAYEYDLTGAGVNVYVMDTGVRITHQEFEGRAHHAYSAFHDNYGADDCHGHGTHVAGIIAGKTYGVAKAAQIYSVRVLGCDGSATTSEVLAGLDWLMANHIKPAVVNMSMGGPSSFVLDDAVADAIKAGIVVVVASGNESKDACNSSPAGLAQALVVGASTSSDSMASFSNFGSCLDLFAPGTEIRSAWNSSNTSVETADGTSMASPFVAGVVALYLENNPQASPDAIINNLLEDATPNRLSNLGVHSPNLLLYSGLATDDPIPTSTPTIKPSATASPTVTPTPTGTTFTPTPTSTTSTPTPTASPDTQSFQDVPTDHWAYRYIEAIHKAGYAFGCSLDGSMYCPDGTITRAEIAVLITRGIYGVSYVPPIDGPETFLDVKKDMWHFKWIEAIADAEFTSGCTADHDYYCPLALHKVSDGSVLYLRLMNGSDYQPLSPEGLFEDAATWEWYTPWLEAAYHAGLIWPCEKEPEFKICPNKPLDRAMAAFMLVKALGLEVE